MTAVIHHPLFRRHPQKHDRRDPVDDILAEHYRQRLLVNELSDLANDLDGPYARGTARLILSYLFEDLSAHEDFEDKHLAAMLKRRCRLPDNLDSLLAIMMWDHFVIRCYGHKVRLGLADIMEGRQMRDVFQFRHDVERFSVRLKGHIVWENSTIVPLTRKRLNQTDLRELAELATDAKRYDAWPALQTESPYMSLTTGHPA